MRKEVVVSVLIALVLFGSCVIPPENPVEDAFKKSAPPVADFSVGQKIIMTGDQVTFDGSLSKDPEGETLTFKWEFYRTPIIREAI